MGFKSSFWRKTVPSQIGDYRDVIKTQVSVYNTLKSHKPDMSENELLNGVIISRMRAVPRVGKKKEEQAHYAPLLKRSDKTLEDVIWAIIDYEYILSRAQESIIKGQELGLTIDEIGRTWRDFETSVRQEIRELLEQRRESREAMDESSRVEQTLTSRIASMDNSEWEILRETRVDVRHIEHFLPFLAEGIIDDLVACPDTAWERWLDREFTQQLEPDPNPELDSATNQLVVALQMGLLLAEHQPELRDAALAILESRGVSADEGWLAILEPYQGFVSSTGKEHWESDSDSVNPSHFGEFLSYLGKGLLIEMARHAGKDWQEACRKRGELKLKRPEKAKVLTVGNCVSSAFLLGLILAEKQPELLSVDWSMGVSLDMLWKRILYTYRAFMFYTTYVR